MLVVEPSALQVGLLSALYFGQLIAHLTPEQHGVSKITAGKPGG